MGKWFVGALLIFAAVVACSSDDPSPPGCLRAGVGPGAVPGVVVLGPGLVLQVRDPFGRGQAFGTTATVRRTDGSLAPAEIQDTLNIYSVYGVDGTFSVTLARPFYRDTTIANVVVAFSPQGCLNRTTIPVTLQLAAGAPPIRAITILGAEFLDQPGARAQLVAHFDANPGVSTAVTWQLSDTTLVTIDANGLVTAKCSKSGGTENVSAKSIADPSVTASVNIGVAPATCA